MIIALTILSILAVTALVFQWNKLASPKICPICAGVSVTWAWLLIAYFAGFDINLLIPAILMGGSAVGIAYTSEKFLPREKSQLLWKSLFIPAGFAAVFFLLEKDWVFFGGSLIAAAVVAMFFFLGKRPPPNLEETKTINKLTEKMEKCC